MINKGFNMPVVFFLFAFLLFIPVYSFAACGDGICDVSAGESFTSCVADCDTCGNGYCGYTESSSSCPSDCGASGGTGNTVGLDPYSFGVSSGFGGGSFLDRSGSGVSANLLGPYTPSGGSSDTPGSGVGVLGGSVQQGAGVGALGSTFSIGNFNIGVSVGLGAGVGSLTAPNQSAYTNASYSGACDCKEVFSDFISQIKSSSLFSVISFSNLTGSSTGSSSYSIPTDSWGSLSFDLAKYASVYSYIAALLILLASVLSVRIIAIKR